MLSEITNPIYQEDIHAAPLFIKREETKFRNFIAEHITKGSHRDLLYALDHCEVHPSKALQDTPSSMLKGNEEFFMLDKQKIVDETVLECMDKAFQDKQKYTIIVQGDLGTGKSVVAVQLLVELVANRNQKAQYVTKNTSPRSVYFSKLRQDNYRLCYISNLFKGSGSYSNCPENAFSCLIVDEVHRLNQKSGPYANLGENQIKEIIQASQVSVFFIDESQVVTVKDIGSITEINQWANHCGSHVICDETTVLTSQFRCNGSDGYICFLDDLLGIQSTANFDGDYEIQIFDNPFKMREILRQKNLINNKARIVAGYCYDWITKNPMTHRFSTLN